MLRQVIKMEQGSTLVLTGVAMAVLVGFAALAVDGGYMYFRHTELQDLADAVALAAAHEMAAVSGTTGQKQAAAFSAAVACAERNGFSVFGACGYSVDIAKRGEPGHMSLAFPAGASEARVSLQLDASTFLSKVLAVESAPLGVTATAEIIRHLGSDSTDLLPLAFFHGTYKTGTLVEMTLAPGDGVKGNYGFLNYGCPCRFRDYLEGGYPGTVSMGDVVETYPGVSSGQVRQGLADRLAGCAHGCTMTPEVSITEPCPRVAVVPMVSGFYEACGKSYVTVTGFVKIFIQNYNESTKVLTAWTLGQAGPSGFTGTEALAQRSARLK